MRGLTTACVPKQTEKHIAKAYVIRTSERGGTPAPTGTPAVAFLKTHRHDAGSYFSKTEKQIARAFCRVLPSENPAQ